MLSIDKINQLEKENRQLKAENEQLKSLCDTYKTCYQAKHSDIKCLFIKYKQTLQEIKAIAEVVIDNDNSLKTDHCFGHCGECSSFEHCKLYPYWQITQLITKAEAE